MEVTFKRLFVNLPTGYKISFGPGKFDEWCIYFENVDSGLVLFPKDLEYFTSLDTIGYSYNHSDLYEDFVTLYNMTGDEEQAKPEVMEWIYSTAEEKYKTFKHKIINIFAILYAGMVAEERKENKVLGKRIKRLGVYQTLIERQGAHYAANYSRGMKADKLITECEQRGF